MAEWLPLAEGGDAVAQNSVGALYDHGLGVDEDDIEAVRWYQMAADQGLPLAMRNLAGMYAGGYGVGFDKDQAIYWYDKAAQSGDHKAAERLSALDPSRATLPASEPTAEPMTVAGGDDEASMGDGGAAAAQEPQVAAAPETPPETSAEPVAEPAPAPVPSASGPEAGTAAQSGDMQYGEGSTEPAAPAVQQASIATPPAVVGNWLIGQWEGPSLGCPPGGGLEFTSNETLSYFGGRVAASLQASYTVKGDLITVISTGVDGVGHSYEYRRSAPDRFTIASVPSDMPANMVGVEYKRCGAAATETAALPVTAPAAPPAAAPAAAEPTPQPFVPSTESTGEPAAAAPAQPASTLTVPTTATAPSVQSGAQSAAKLPAAPGTGGDAAQAGWDAFGRGDYQGALDVWKPVAEAGNTDMQILVGSIYDFGQGVPQDDAEAAKWYQMAAEKGSAKAQYQLGALYARSPQAKDPKKAYEWLSIAAKTIGTGNVGGITADQATTMAALAKMSLSDAEVKEAEAAAKAFTAKP